MTITYMFVEILILRLEHDVFSGTILKLPSLLNFRIYKNSVDVCFSQ